MRNTQLAKILCHRHLPHHFQLKSVPTGRHTAQPGETRTVKFEINVNQLAYYNIDMCYVLTPGKVEIMVGRSAHDLPLQGEFIIEGHEIEIKDKKFFSDTSLF